MNVYVVFVFKSELVRARSDGSSISVSASPAAAEPGNNDGTGAPFGVEGQTTVRDRENSEGQISTYKQPWTSEEQRRLEQLLIEFPTERVEARRYRKIAQRLGNKTMKQVRKMGERDCACIVHNQLFL